MKFQRIQDLRIDLICLRSRSAKFSISVSDLIHIMKQAPEIFLWKCLSAWRIIIISALIILWGAATEKKRSEKTDRQSAVMQAAVSVYLPEQSPASIRPDH